MHQFDRCWGIEILESLSNISIQVKSAYDTYINEVDPAIYEQTFGWPSNAAPRFEPAHGDIFKLDWAAEADLIFCNSTALNV